MLSVAVRIADAINNSKFHASDEVVLAEGPRKYVHGIFLRLKDDVEWAAIKEAAGAAMPNRSNAVISAGRQNFRRTWSWEVHCVIPET
jgi:hypothetical protein